MTDKIYYQLIRVNDSIRNAREEIAKFEWESAQLMRLITQEIKIRKLPAPRD